MRDDDPTHPVSFNKTHKHREEDGGRRCFGVLPEELHRLVEGILSKDRQWTFKTPLQQQSLKITKIMEQMQSEVCLCYLCNLGIVLQLLQLALIVCDEVFEHGVVAVHAVLSLGQLHASRQLLNIQQDVLQRHCEHEQTYEYVQPHN